MHDSRRERPVTIRDIAAEAGVSAAAVSLALRGSPQVSAALRERVCALAEQMGYRPNPLLSAYQAQVRALKPVKFQATLGWVNDSPDKDLWRKAWNRPMHDGARQRAMALGYALDDIWIPDVRTDDLEVNYVKYRRILASRGISGVILPTLHRPQHSVLPWDGLATVCIGRHHIFVENSRMNLPRVCEHHIVDEDHFTNTRLAIRKLREAGCRRIGLAISAWLDRRTDGLRSAAFLQKANEWPANERVPILLTDHEGDLARWMKKHQPDAILCQHSEILRYVKNTGKRVPDDVRVIHLSIAPDVADWSGIDPRLEQIGSAAVDMATAHLIRNERGVPTCAKQLSIEGRWVEGNT